MLIKTYVNNLSYIHMFFMFQFLGNAGRENMEEN